MLNIYKQALLDAGCFKHVYPDIIKVGMNTVSTNAPEKMKALLIASELTVFASNLRKPIMWDGTLIPVNIISFVIADSGIGKDSSMKSIRNALAPAYEKINKYREIHAKAQAVEDAETDGKKPTDWRKYYSKPRDLFSGIGTIEGQMKHLANLEAGKLGAGYIQVSELGSELHNNPDIANNIVALAVGFDTGYIPAKTVKSDDHQVDPIKNLPFSGLMFGSPANIVFDEKVKNTFKDEFSSKLSRRSFLSFNQDAPKRLIFETKEEARAYRRAEKEKANEAAEAIEPWLTSLVDATSQKPLEVTQEVEDLFGDYKDYNEWFSDGMNKQHPISILHRQHMQWKALKLAGALAILNNDEIIEAHHYVSAVNFTEIFSEDLEQFEIELAKEPYELLISYMHHNHNNGFLSISIHQLRKLGFIKGTGSQKKLLEIADLANNADDSRYEVSGNYIHFYLAEEQQQDYGELA